jgi:hypothetical protein
MSESGPNSGAPGAEEGPTGGVGEERTWWVRTERLFVTSGDLWGKLRQLVHEGNVRRIIVRSHDERVLIDIPVSIGVVGAVLAPFAVAMAAAAAVATRCTLEIERVEVAPADEDEAADKDETAGDGRDAEAGAPEGKTDAPGEAAKASPRRKPAPRKSQG